jgi:hypothetical protein
MVQNSSFVLVGLLEPCLSECYSMGLVDYGYVVVPISIHSLYRRKVIATLIEKV